MARDAAAAAQRYLGRAGRLLKQSEWQENGQSNYLVACAQVEALLDLAAAIRGDEEGRDEDGEVPVGEEVEVAEVAEPQPVEGEGG
jgi:hypothetical protein